MSIMRNKMLVFSSVLCIISVCFMIFVLIQGNVEKSFVPQRFDQTAQKGIPQVPDNLGWSSLEAGDINVSICGSITVEDGESDVWLYNNEKNNVWIKLRILDDHSNILGETGLVRPGEYVQSITYEHIPKKESNIVLKIMTYEPETYYSAGSINLNTKVKG